MPITISYEIRRDRNTVDPIKLLAVPGLASYAALAPLVSTSNTQSRTVTGVRGTVALAANAPTLANGLWPTPATTGTSGTLLRVGVDVSSGTGWTYNSGTGNITVTANCSLTNLDVPNGFFLSGGVHQVVATNCKFRGIGSGAGAFITNFNGNGAKAINCEFGGGADGSTIVVGIGIYGAASSADGIVVDSCYFHHLEHGLHSDGGVTVRDSFFDHMLMGDAILPGAHTECMFISSGADTHVDHCWMRYGNGSVLFAQASAGKTITSATIENSYFATVTANGQISPFGVGFQSTDSAHNPSLPNPGLVTIRNNTFERSPWNVGALEAPTGSVTSNNVYADDGTAVPIHFN